MIEDSPTYETAKHFVQSCLVEIGIQFPFDEVREVEALEMSPSITQEKLTIIFYEAVFDYEIAICEERLSDPKAKRFIKMVYDWIDRKQEYLANTFGDLVNEDFQPFITDEEKKAEQEKIAQLDEEELKWYRKITEQSTTSITTPYQISDLLWQFAYNHQTVPKALKHVLLKITSPELHKMLNSYIKSMNAFIQQHVDVAAEKTKVVAKVENDFNQLRHDLRKEYNQKLNEIRQQAACGNRTSKRLKKLLTNPYSSITQTYDLTSEDGVKNYIDWFFLMDAKITNPLLKALVAKLGGEENSQLLIEKVKEHNAWWLARHPNVEETKSEDDDNKEVVENVYTKGNPLAKRIY